MCIILKSQFYFFIIIFSAFSLIPLQFSTCNIHSWSIDCSSRRNFLKRESSCAFLMDCACLPLLYMDRELFWRSVILFSHRHSSTLLFFSFWREREYLQSSLHIFQKLLGWLGWLTLDPGGNEAFSLLSWRSSVMKRDADLLLSCKIFTLSTVSDPRCVASFSPS